MMASLAPSIALLASLVAQEPAIESSDVAAIGRQCRRVYYESLAENAPANYFVRYRESRVVHSADQAAQLVRRAVVAGSAPAWAPASSQIEEFLVSRVPIGSPVHDSTFSSIGIAVRTDGGLVRQVAQSEAGEFVWQKVWDRDTGAHLWVAGADDDIVVYPWDSSADPYPGHWAKPAPHLDDGLQLLIAAAEVGEGGDAFRKQEANTCTIRFGGPEGISRRSGWSPPISVPAFLYDLGGSITISVYARSDGAYDVSIDTRGPAGTLLIRREYWGIGSANAPYERERHTKRIDDAVYQEFEWLFSAESPSNDRVSPWIQPPDLGGRAVRDTRLGLSPVVRYQYAGEVPSISELREMLESGKTE